MNKNTIKLILLYLIKFSGIAVFASIGLHKYDPSSAFYNQNLNVYLLVYLPLLMGYESLLSVLFSKKKEQTKE